VKRFATCVLFLSLALPLHGQSGIELPKPSAGSLGIHFKLMQSIPYQGLGGYGRNEDDEPAAILRPDNKTIALPVRRSYNARYSDDNSGTEFKLYNVVSGNVVGSLGLIQAISVASPDLSVAVGCNVSYGLVSSNKVSLDFYRLGGSGTLHPSASAQLKDCSPSEPFQFSPVGSFLALVVDQKVEIWDSRNAKLVATLTTSDKITHVSFSSDSRMMLASAEDGTVRVWEIPSGQIIQTFDAQHSVNWADFVPGRAAICALTGDGGVFIWDLKTGQRVIFFNLDPRDDGRRVGVLSPDGRLLITPGSDSVTGPDGQRLLDEGVAYDLQSGARLAALQVEYDAGSGRVLDVGISPDGTMVVTTRDAEDGNYIVHIWRIERE